MATNKSHSSTPFRPVSATEERVFASGERHFNALITDIHAAKKSIDLETYIFQHDHLGKRVVEALCTAASRGVKVRVLVDGAGSPLWTMSFARKLENAKVETKVFHPFPWHLWNWSRSTVRLPLLLKWIYLALKMNSRNHRKVCIIDHNVAYVGSFNISKCHLEKTAGGDEWRDTSVRICHSDFSELAKAFNCAWTQHPIKERLREVFRHIRQDPAFRVNYTWLRRRILYRNLLRKISKCHQRIWITNAYFVPDNFLLRKLKEAARSGVDVRILLPKKSDVLVMPWASSTFYYSLLKAGVRIFEYLPSMLHAKSLLLDSWVLIGSSNLNHRSILHDLEADVSITTQPAKQRIEQLFIDDLTKAKEISLESWHKARPWRQRFMGRLVLYLKFWI